MDRDAMRVFMGQYMQMASGAAVMGVMAVADRTGLFAALEGEGPMTLAEVVERSGLQPRYLQEVLATLSAAGVLVYDERTERYELPAEHAACVADETSPYFLGGWSQVVPALYRAIPGVVRACREGGGVSFGEFGPEMVEGIARSNGPGTRILLTRRWLPAMPDVVERLEAGIRVADVGCGSGVAAITMARAYPRSSVIGFDVDATSVERARAEAEREGLENVLFEQITGEEIPLDPGFDFVTTFDVIHDLVNPREVLSRIRRALRPSATYLMVEPAVADRLEENLNPVGALTYAMSTLHCMTVSLAHGGEGLGAAWGPGRAEVYCREAGFGEFHKLDLDNVFNAFYRVRV